MKKICLFLIFCSLFEIAPGQKRLLLQPYHPRASKTTIANLLQDIKEQTGIIFEYSSGYLDAEKTVHLGGHESTIADVVQEILTGRRVKLLVHNNKLIIVPSDTLFSISHFLPNSYSLYGYVKLSEGDEPLIGATLYEPATKRGVFSNEQGYFNFKLSKGEHLIKVSYAGLQSKALKINISGNQHRDISLSPKKEMLTAVVVESKDHTGDGAIELTGEEVFSGGMTNDDDPMQYLYLYPSVHNTSYSFSGFQVRGGGSDENLFLLDGNPVYNPTHLMGAISIINPTVLKSIRFYDGYFPAQLGGALSSVLDVTTKQGNMENWQGEVNVGVLAGSLTLEGPLVRNKVAVMLSARKHIPFSFYNTLQDGLTSDFYDAQLRLSAMLNPRNKLAINLYKGEDQLKKTGTYISNRNQWGNTVGSINWNYVMGSQAIINTSINYSAYQNLGSFQYTLFEKDIDYDQDDDDDDIDEDEMDDDIELETRFINTYSSIQNYNIKSKAEIYASPDLKFNAGAKLSQTNIKPFDSKVTVYSEGEMDDEDFKSFEPLQFQALSLFVEAETKLGDHFFIRPGFRANIYQFQDYRTPIYQPRLYLAYHFYPSHKIHASYSKMNQFLHLVTNPYAGVNRDLWVPSTEKLQPEISRIYNIGYSYHHNMSWKVSIDGYYKGLKNVTNFAEGKSTFIDDDDWQQNIELGTGRSYGAELMFNHTGQRLSMHASYGLSWSWRRFKSINDGKEFPYKYDHRHTIQLQLKYALTPRIDLAGSWGYSTGNVYSHGVPVFVDSLQINNDDNLLEDYDFIYQYSKQTQYRAKSYQRYDFSISYHSLKTSKLYSLFTMGIYNINGAADQYTHSLRGSLSTKQIRIKTGRSAFNLIPYISYSLTF